MEQSSESSRQYEYMEEMKKWVQKKSEELGRKLTCHVTTFGCQMNEKIQKSYSESQKRSDMKKLRQKMQTS